MTDTTKPERVCAFCAGTGTMMMGEAVAATHKPGCSLAHIAYPFASCTCHLPTPDAVTALRISDQDIAAAAEIVCWWDTGKLEGGILSGIADEMVRISRADESMNIRQAEQAVISRIVRAVVARAALTKGAEHVR